MLMKTCGLTLKIAEIRYRNVVLFLVPSLFIWAFCRCFFVQNALVCFMDILFTVSNTVKLFLFYHTVNSISTVPPVVNNKGTKNWYAFYWNAFKFQTQESSSFSSCETSDTESCSLPVNSASLLRRQQAGQKAPTVRGHVLRKAKVRGHKLEQRGCL